MGQDGRLTSNDMNATQRRIPEAEFIAFEDKTLADFARLIQESGASLYEIAHACGLSWETVKAAANAVPVKFSTLCRIWYCLKKKQR